MVPRTAEEVHRDLVAEFHQLNETFFDNGLKMPAIILSRRKSFGGYYQPARHRIVLSWQAYEEYGWDETLNTFRHSLSIVRRDFQMGLLRRHVLAVPQRDLSACLVMVVGTERAGRGAREGRAIAPTI